MAYEGPHPLPVPSGGTGQSSFTNHSALLASGTTNTGSLQNIASVATGQVLTSAGTSTIPTWSATPTLTSITFGSGTVLNTYAEGTWTPSITFGGGSTGITYTTQAGYYTRIGRIVAAQFQLLLSNKGSSSGTAIITGLPFAAANLSSNASIVAMRVDNITFPAGTTYISGQVVATLTSINLQAYGSGIAAINLADTNFANNSLLEGTLVYFA